MTRVDVLLAAPAERIGGVSALVLHDEALTYSLFEPGRVGVIDLATLRATERLGTPAGLSGMARGDDGSLYLANVWARTLSRLAPGRSVAEVLLSSEGSAVTSLRADARGVIFTCNGTPRRPGAVRAWRDHGAVHPLAALGVPVMSAAADARWVYVGTSRPCGPERGIVLRVAR